MADKVLIVPIRKFDVYSVSYNKEFTAALKASYWNTNENYVFYLGVKHSNEWVVVPRGYATDGASVPPAFQTILPVFGKDGACAILHDWLCEYGFVWHRNPLTGEVTKRFLTRLEIDNIFLEALGVVGIEPRTIELVRIGFIAHRTWSNPPVPNLDVAKQKLEINLAQSNGWTPFDGSQLWDVIDAPPVWAFV